jgi:hypothetical protein
MALSISICDRFENYGCQRGVKPNFLRAHEGKWFFFNVEGDGSD